MIIERNTTTGRGVSAGAVEVSSIAPAVFEAAAPRTTANLVGMLSKYTTRTDLSKLYMSRDW